MFTDEGKVNFLIQKNVYGDQQNWIYTYFSLDKFHGAPPQARSQNICIMTYSI